MINMNNLSLDITGELHLSWSEATLPQNYKSDGIYIVRDTPTLQTYLVSVVGTVPAIIVAPANIKLNKRDDVGEIIGKLDKLTEIVSLLSEVETPKSSGDVNITDLTKLIAVAQKPELIKE